MANNLSLKQQILDIVLATDCIVREPNIGKDGFIAPTYPSAKLVLNDQRFIQAFPAAAQAVLQNIKNIDVVVGIELSGIAPAALVAYALNKPFAYVRKKPKPYGRRLSIQGNVNSKRVLLVDDLLFYGQTKDEAVKKITDAGGKVTNLFVVLTVDPLSKEWAKRTKIPVHRLFDREEIYQSGVKKGVISQELYDLEKEIFSLKDYKYWHENRKLWDRFITLMTTDPTFVKK